MSRPALGDAELVPALRAEFAAAGFDLCAPFAAGAYNEHEQIAGRPDLLIPAKSRVTLAIVVGNTRELWMPFVRHLKSSLEGAAILKSQDPLDEYTKHIVQRVLAQCAPGEEAEIVFAFETVEANGRCCSVHTAGHVAGLAWYDAENTQRSLHPVYGPWFGYRAVITLPSRAWAKSLPGSADGSLRCPCERAELQKVAAMQAEVMAKWGTVSERESWDGLVAVASAFTVGAEFRYSPAQLRFHYSPDAAERTAVLLESTA
ncbi:hypothetical protein KFE25_000287 [Diacronema lutheri]|uniref:Cyanocobalamin reductase (cyanide-eliminating) n=1 Tax=Diacronema lutheri TaxID=2081491 RepID=A0A7R9UYM0_DIALT|nr:hypothetical protein KFE25_000287 [Diacronema lutheri]